MIEYVYTKVIQIIVLMLAISVHESAHAYSADRMGDPTARYLGRVTLNPLPHIDLFGTILVPLMCMLFSNFIIGWAKPCPVNANNFKNPRRDNMIVAFAGPFSNILLAALSSIIFLIFSFLLPIKGTLAELFFAQLIFLNILLALFNLIPIPPLDGSWILRGIIPINWVYSYDSIQQYGFLIVIILMFTGVLGAVLFPLVKFLFALFTFFW